MIKTLRTLICLLLIFWSVTAVAQKNGFKFIGYPGILHSGDLRPYILSVGYERHIDSTNSIVLTGNAFYLAGEHVVFIYGVMPGYRKYLRKPIEGRRNIYWVEMYGNLKSFESYGAFNVQSSLRYGLGAAIGIRRFAKRRKAWFWELGAGSSYAWEVDRINWKYSADLSEKIHEQDKERFIPLPRVLFHCGFRF